MSILGTRVVRTEDPLFPTRRNPERAAGVLAGAA